MTAATERTVVTQCTGCWTIIYDRKNLRRYCSTDCRARHEARRILDKYAEFEWIAGTDTWDNIATRLGHPDIRRLREWLRRHGHDDWADRISADIDILRPRQGRWAA